MPNQDSIAIIGIGCNLPGGIQSPEEFWELLSNGKEAITEVPRSRWDLESHFHPDPRNPLTQHVKRGGFLQNIDSFDPGFFGITPREAICMDPQQRLLLEVAWRSIENASQPLDKLRGNSVGVFVGISSADYSSLLWASKQDYLTPDNEPFILPGNTGCIAANRISYFLDLKGPSFTVDTACSSSLVAVHLACESILRGESDLAFAGGVQALIHPGIQMSFCKAGLLSPEGRCKSFDAEANGYVRSEGAGMVLLKPLSAALRDRDPIHALIRGTAINSDGRSQGLAAPSQRSQAACVRKAFEHAGLNPNETQYVEAHGTGTRQGDPIELRALGSVLGEDRPKESPCKVGSVKSNLGHGETAAGITGLIKTALCIKNAKIPPSLHFQTPNPSIDFQKLGLKVQTTLEEFPNPSKALIAGVSSFGFGGTNAHAVLSEAPNKIEQENSKLSSTPEPPIYLFCISAKTPQALDLLVEDYAELLSSSPSKSLNNIIANTHLGRSIFAHRFIAVGETRDEILDQLRKKVPPAWEGEAASQSKNARKKQNPLSNIKLGIKGKEGKEKLQDLAKEIGKGAYIDWTLFHSKYPYEQINIPGHPFIKQRYWWNEVGGSNSKSSLWLDHLGKNQVKNNGEVKDSKITLKKIELPGNLEHFSTQINTNLTKDLSDHVIRDWIVFPAAGYLELAIEQSYKDNNCIALSEFKVESALKIDSSKEIEFQAILDRQGYMSFYSQSKDNKSWLKHGGIKCTAQGFDQSKKDLLPEPSFTEAPATSHCIDVASFYKKLSLIGFEYGNSYQTIEEIKATDNDSWALISRPIGAPDRCLIDGCFQAVAACMMLNHSNSQIFLPIGIEDLELSSWPLPDQFKCHVKLQSGEEENSTLKANLLLKSNDKFLGKITGLKLRRVTRSLLDLLFPLKEKSLLGPELYETVWSTNPLKEQINFPNHHDEIFLISNKELISGSLTEWADSQDIELKKLSIEDIPLDSIKPILVWPDIYKDSPLNSVAEMLNLLKHLSDSPPRQLLIVLEGKSDSANALTAFLRTALLERADLQITTLHISNKINNHPIAEDWSKILLASNTQAEISWEGGVLKGPNLKPLEEEKFQIRTDGSGRIEGLHKQPLQSASLLPGEVEIVVEATGLNFRDVLNALGLLKQHAASLGLDDQTRLPFGGEAVGVVIAVGPDVSNKLIGQRVIAALTIGSLASHVIAREELCVPLPEGMSVEEGASFSTAYLTAQYGLKTIANLKANESVLIHAAAGGVGQAALQVAKRTGAKIFATASQSKQPFLIEQGVDAVFDSRSLDFSDQILDLTNGVGVDVVLNSLKGSWVDESFRCIKDGGRFLELGKIDIWSKEKASKMRPNVIYKPFDLLEVVARDPDQIKNLLSQITQDITTGKLMPIPQKSWSIDHYQEAFKVMAQARHVGKVVITHPTKPDPITIKSDGTYLITGGLGGIGLQLAYWLADQGARSLIFISRHAEKPNEEAIKALTKLEEQGVKYILSSCDFSESKESLTGKNLTNLLNILPKNKPLRGIFHAAGILNDGLISNLDENLIKSTMLPKVNGWQLMQALSKSQPNIDFLIGFSSVASLLGSPGQAAYGAANGAMEAYCEANSSMPICLSIQWGPWKGPGMAADLESRFESVGIGMLKPKDALQSIGKLLNRGKGGVVCVVQNDWPKLVSQSIPRQRSWFNNLLEEVGPSAAEKTWHKLQQLPQSEWQKKLMNELRELLAEVMAAEAEEDLLEATSIDSNASLFNLGLDSLMAVEYAAVVQAELGIRLDLEALSDDPTLDALATLGIKQLTPQKGQQNFEVLNLDKEAKLDKDWARPGLPANSSPGNSVLLTGSSGFLGAYLLAGQLNRWEDIQVQCLVRAENTDHGLNRIKKNLKKYDLWEPSWSERLSAIPGDLALPFFGLEEKEFIKLSKGIGGILHNGAQLSQMASYAQLAATNVGGTKEVLKLATIENPIRVELISSVSVFESAAYRNKEIFETDDLAAWQGIHIGYSQTKWVSERLILEAGEHGLPISIYRPPLIGGHSLTGHWHEGDLLQRLLQGCLALGQAPQLAWELDLVPVDYVAEAVSALAWSPEAEGKCFHLQHPRPLMLNDLLAKLISDGAPLKQVPMEEWLAAIASNSDNPLYPLRAFFQQRWGEEKLTYPELNALGVRARPSCTWTREVLDPLDIYCPDFDDLIGAWGSSLLRSSVIA